MNLTDKKDYSGLVLFILGAIILFQQAWVEGFFADGHLYAAFGKNAAEKGFWLVPRLSESTYERWPQHPSLFFIAEGLFFKIFGSSYTSARIFGASFTFLTYLFLFISLKKLKGFHLAYLSTLILILTLPLIKKSRFPNLDLPLMLFLFCGLILFFLAYQNNKWSSWLGAGTMFGLALLVKGPPAMMLPIGIFAFSAVSDRLKMFLGIKPWVALIVGFLIFTLWPMSLFLSGNHDIFLDYFNYQVLDSAISGRGNSDLKFFTYFIHLAKYCGPWFLLTIIGTIKLKKDSFLTLLLSFFWTNLILLSFAKLKYSNYLIPLFPMMAAIAALTLNQWIPKKIDIWAKIKTSVTFITITLGLVLLIFPITNVSKRDKEMRTAYHLVDQLKSKPSAWAVVDHSYPFFALANYLAFKDYISTYQIPREGFMKWLNDGNYEDYIEQYTQQNFEDKKWAFVLTLQQYQSIKDDPSFKSKTVSFYKSRKNDFVIVLEKGLLAEDQIFFSN